MSASEVTARVREALAPYVESGRLPGYVGGVTVAGETDVCAAGTLALGSEVPMQPRTIFRIASLTKPVAGALALTVVQDGTIGLDDEIRRWLPELATPRVRARLHRA
jgi:CubicO group peptidase (beta-lactamase class C family)